MGKRFPTAAWTALRLEDARCGFSLSGTKVQWYEVKRVMQEKIE